MQRRPAAVTAVLLTKKKKSVRYTFKNDDHFSDDVRRSGRGSLSRGNAPRIVVAAHWMFIHVRMDGKMTRRMEEGGAVHHGRQMYKRGSWRTRANHLAAVGGSGITFFLGSRYYHHPS